MSFLSKFFYSDVFFTFIIEHPFVIEFQGIITTIIAILIIFFILILFYFVDEKYIKTFFLMTIMAIMTSLFYYYHYFNNQSEIDGINYYVSQNPNGLYSKRITEHCIPRYLNEYKKAEFYPFVLSCVQSYAKELLEDKKRQEEHERQMRHDKIELDKRHHEEQEVREKFKIN